MSFVIPAIDLIGGRAVRLVRGDYAQVTDFGDPCELAQIYIKAGAKRLHIVDLEAAKGEGNNNLATLKKIIRLAENAQVAIQTGGGVRKRADIDARVDIGASQVICGTSAASDTQGFIGMVAGREQQVILGLDTRKGKVRISGWRKSARLKTSELLHRLGGLALYGIVHTDIDRDGTGEGPNLKATLELGQEIAKYPALAESKLIVSGGAATLEHIENAAEYSRFAGIVVGTALCKGDIDLHQALAVPSN